MSLLAFSQVKEVTPSRMKFMEGGQYFDSLNIIHNIKCYHNKTLAKKAFVKS